MKNNQMTEPGVIISIIVFMLVLIALMLFMCKVIYDRGYYEGQIDAINGIIKYELTTTSDSSSRWERKIDK